MRIELAIRTGNGNKSSMEEVEATTERLMRIAREIRGNIVDGRGYSDGAMLVIED